MSSPYHMEYPADIAVSVCGGEVVAIGRLAVPAACADPATVILREIYASEVSASSYVLCHLRQGSGWYQLHESKRRVRLAAGDTFLLYPNMQKSLVLDSAGGCEIAWLTMRGPSLDVICNGGGVTPANPRHARESREVMTRKFNELELLCREATPSSRYGLHSFGLHLFAILNSGGSDLSTPTDSVHREAIQKAKSIIADRLDDPPSVEELAGDLGMSTRVFRRAFDSEEGMTPKSFIVHRRLQSVMGLLAKTDLTVSEIADQLGFSSPFFLTRQFTQHTGKSPDAWRKEHTRATTA